MPYRGVAAGAMNDRITNRINRMFNTTGSLCRRCAPVEVRGSGAIDARALAARAGSPTFAEAGVPGFNVSSWYGLFAPAKTPREIVAKMHDSVADQVLKEPAIKSRYEVLGVEARRYARQRDRSCAQGLGADRQGGGHREGLRHRPLSDAEPRAKRVYVALDALRARPP